MKQTCPLALILVLGLNVLAGCNVFEGFYEEGSSKDPDVLLQDASFALRAGEPEKAVQYLERALARNPGDPRPANDIRLMLATALLGANDIGVLTLDRITSDLLDQLDASGVRPTAGKGASTYCSFDARGDERRQEVVLDTPTFQDIQDKKMVLDRVIDLLNEVFRFPSTAPRDILVGVERLTEQGFTEQEIQRHLFVLAAAYVARTYIDVVEAGLSQITWVRVLPAGGGKAYLGLCAPSPEIIEAVKQATACAMEDLLIAVQLMDARTVVLGLGAEAPAVKIVGEAGDAYDRLAVELAEAECVR